MTDSIDRRTMLQLMAAGTAASAASAVVAADARQDHAAALSHWQAKPSKDGVLRFALDIAVLGHTDAPNSAGRIGDPRSQEYFTMDSRGDSFYCEGLVYPGETMPMPTIPTAISVFPRAPLKLHNQVVWDFKSPVEPVGHWFNRGWILINGNPTPYTDSSGTVVETRRLEPHLLSEHTFLLGVLGPNNLSPETLITSGVENGNDPDIETVTRAVIGGTGRFAHASGQVVQTRLGRNTTALRSFSNKGDVKAPNYRLVFDLKLA